MNKGYFAEKIVFLWFIDIEQDYVIQAKAYYRIFG